MWRIQRRKLSSQLFQVPPGQWRTGRIERHVSTSVHLGNTRGIDIYLPPGYGQSDRAYPVLYMHDGNNLFFRELAFGGMPWGVDRVLDRLISLGFIPPLMVVGVYNTMGRNSEYTWTPMKTRWGTEGGDGPLYGRYLTEELKPFVDQHYATLRGPEHTGVMGSSLGGLISFYLGYYYPHVFGKVGLVSPSLWWNRGQALREAYAYPQGLQLWLDMGTREGKPRKVRVDHSPNIRNVRTLARIFQDRGYHLGENLGYFEDRGGLHNEWWWGQRLHLALLFLWGYPSARQKILKAIQV